MEFCGTIDYSPNPCATDMTICLEEEDLDMASPSQMERFLRVWVRDRSTYAPNLHTLQIRLRGRAESLGIQRFLYMYRPFEGRTNTFVVVLANHTGRNDFRTHYIDCPLCEQ